MSGNYVEDALIGVEGHIRKQEPKDPEGVW